ncbi:MAG: ATP-binding cassette domain-containing protein [Dehalococcoidia bacterium]
MTAAQPATRTAALAVDGIWKRFGDNDAVRDVSFAAEHGQVLGVVGPNGAGKTTSIRIALGILAPDRGGVHVLGKPLAQHSQEHIGYLPEERGLYRGRTIPDTLAFLGELKGLDRSEALRRADSWLERFGMAPHRSKKVGELSHGMAQLVQFTATLMHDPALVVLDEPFSSLDPVNVRLIKDVILDLRNEGRALVLCTHQMHQVEELCDRVVMIDEGTVVLDGSVDEIKRSYRGDTVAVVCDPAPNGLDGVADIRKENQTYMMRMLPGTTPRSILQQLLGQGCEVERFEVVLPSMEDVFVKVVGSRREE